MMKQNFKTKDRLVNSKVILRGKSGEKYILGGKINQGSYGFIYDALNLNNEA